MDSFHCRSRHQEALLKVEPSKKFGKLLNKHVTRFTFSKIERYPQLKPSTKILKNARWCLPSFNSTSQFSLEFSEVSVTPNFFMKANGRLLLTFYYTKRVLLMPAHWKENEFKMCPIYCSKSIIKTPEPCVKSVQRYPLCANPAKWSNTFKQFVGCCRRIIWVFDHFVGLAFKELIIKTSEWHQWLRSNVFIFIFEHISHMVLVFPFLVWTWKCLLRG